MKARELKVGDTVNGWKVTKVQFADETDYGDTWTDHWTLLLLELYPVEEYSRMFGLKWVEDEEEPGTGTLYRSEWFESCVEVNP